MWPVELNEPAGVLGSKKVMYYAKTRRSRMASGAGSKGFGGKGKEHRSLRRLLRLFASRRPTPEKPARIDRPQEAHHAK